MFTFVDGGSWLQVCPYLSGVSLVLKGYAAPFRDWADCRMVGKVSLHLLPGKFIKVEM
jgi:hypothetical protein